MTELVLRWFLLLFFRELSCYVFVAILQLEILVFWNEFLRVIQHLYVCISVYVQSIGKYN